MKVANHAPDADQVYRNYLATCQRLGVEPVPRGHAQELMAEWSNALAATIIPLEHALGRQTMDAELTSD